MVGAQSGLSLARTAIIYLVETYAVHVVSTVALSTSSGIDSMAYGGSVAALLDECWFWVSSRLIHENATPSQ